MEIVSKNTCKSLGMAMDTELNWKRGVQEIKTPPTKATAALASKASGGLDGTRTNEDPNNT
jgi:hypothetical protein